MILFGEKLNSSIPKTLELYKKNDINELIDLIKKQSEADYLDVNTALCDNEPEKMLNVIESIYDNSNAKIMIDSSNVAVLIEIANKIKGDFIINSITAKDRLFELLPIIKEKNCGVIALPIVDDVPASSEERLENARKIINVLKENNISLDKIYFDILIEPVSVDTTKGKVAIETLDLFKKEGLKTTCGLSNISFGLPKRKQINSTFLSMLMCHGLDSAICDVCDEKIIFAVKTSNMLMGNDEFCMEYVLSNK